MMQQGICSQCKVTFTFNDQDRSGKFCSKKCHYDSKNEDATCVHCQKTFARTIKAGRKTCSKECWIGQKGLRSKNPQVKEITSFERAVKSGQIAITETIKTRIMNLHPAFSKFKQEFFPIIFTLAIQWWVGFQFQQWGMIGAWTMNIVTTLLVIYAFSFSYKIYPYSQIASHQAVKISYIAYGTMFHLFMLYAWHANLYHISNVAYLGFYAYVVMFAILFHNAINRIPEDN